MTGPARQPLPLLPAVLWGAAFAVMVALLLATPTLNLDDLAYAHNVPMAMNAVGLPHLLLTALFNADLGVSEIRTFGLARFIQILSVAVSGKAPIATYGFMAIVHAASGFIVYALMRRVTDDRLMAVFAAFAWVGAPAVLPLLKVEHHFLYIIVPYYPLLGWLVFVLAGRRSLPVNVSLLTATWMLGEGAIIPMIAAVAAVAWRGRDWRVARDGGIALSLLGVYVGYQMAFVNNPNQAQRFHWYQTQWDAGDVFRIYGKQLVENGKAILGLGYRDAEIQHQLPGIGTFTSPVAIAVCLALLFATYWACRAHADDAPVKKRPETFMLAGIWLLSLALYLPVSAFGGTGFAVRYTAAFYALLPLVMIGVIALYARPIVARRCAGVIAVLCVSISIGLLHRAEILVNGPNRHLIGTLQQGTAIVIKHQGWMSDADGRVANDYPGLISTYTYGVPDPKRSAWTLTLMLHLHGGVVLGTACHALPDGKIAVLFQGATHGVFEPQAVVALGLPDVHATVATQRTLGDVCTPASL